MVYTFNLHNVICQLYFNKNKIQDPKTVFGVIIACCTHRTVSFMGALNVRAPGDTALVLFFL